MDIFYKNILRTFLSLPACIFIFIFLVNAQITLAQLKPVEKINAAAAHPALKFSSNKVDDLFGSRANFIENVGQYGQTITGYNQMGKIKFGYEGLGMPVLFTVKGLIHLQRKIEMLSHEEEERMERKGIPESEIEKEKRITDRTISMEWLGANSAVEIVAEGRTSSYYTYGSLKAKAYGYKKITYKNLYPGIDLVYNFNDHDKPGFEYSLLVRAGADINAVQLKYGGDVKKIKTDSKGNLIISSDIDGISTTVPVSYYGATLQKHNFNNIITTFKTAGDTVKFVLPQGFDNSKAFCIDPFVTATGNLTGLNAGKAKDVDFDYAGNIYVTGGGDGNIHKLSKFDAAGNLIWTFTGTTVIPAWSFGPYYGGSVVEKSTGNVYLGQGFSPATGYRIVRISTTGLYDNYISDGNPGFNEAWKLYWSCNNGSPRILVVGGGTSSTLNLGILVPPATAVAPLNITGASGICCQDMVDMVFDQNNLDIYSVFASLGGTPFVNNRMYKNNAPYSAATIAWNRLSGFTSLSEAFNRPYLVAPGGGGGLMDNSANVLSLNGSYLYYWDGKNLKAFDKTTGADVGTSLITANTALAQGGIIADACNNIFVGEGNGFIKVYKFTGTVFDDAAAPDIAIPGFAGKAVYDLAYDESKKLLYACGNGFVGSFDVSSYNCLNTQYNLNVVPDCLTSSATVTITPAPPAGSTVTYTLFNGNIQVATNNTGIFTGLSPNITYTVTATINQACSGIQVSTSFVLPGAAIIALVTNATCGNNTGTITATGSGTTAPYSYSTDGTNFQASGIFTGLAAGVYTVTVRDASGCKNTKTVTILNTNGPALSFTSTNANCGSNNGGITATATGGVSPYQYSLNGTTFQSSNFFTGILAGTYTLTVKDVNGCTNAAVFTITSTLQPLLTAIPAAATCGGTNGSITAFGSGGTAPLQYSINGNIFQASNNFTGLAPGSFTVTVKDANGCTNTTTVTVPNSPAPVVSAIATAASCNNVNGTITATGTGGIAPLSYSINGTFFSISNIFTGLAAGTYTVTVKDATGCTSITSVTVANIGGPSVTATSGVSACNVNNGSITVTATTGTPGYQYSINNTTYQVSNVFTGLAAGTYVVYVKDAIGCIGTFTIVVGNTAGPSITATASPTACNSNTGIITATGTGGIAPLQYSIDGVTYVAGNIFTGLATGIYFAFVKDANGCIKNTSVVITNASGLSLTVSSISASCSLNSGIINATAIGGIAPLQYSINGTVYQASNIFSGLTAGAYTVYVKDANNCIVTKNVIVSNASTLVLSAAVQFQASCSAANGVIVATGNGGVAPLTYNIDGAAYQAISTFINIAVGIHTITVKDATGCTATQTVTIINSGTGTIPTDITFTLRNTLACTGGFGRIKNLKGLPGGGGTNYEFSLDSGPFLQPNDPIFRNVPAGVHTITTRDQGSTCTITKIFVIGIGTPATATASSTSSACGSSTGTITIVGVGPNTPYHASINNGVTWNTFFPPGANSFTYANLAPGTYSIIIADDADFIAGTPDIPGACLTTIFISVPSIGGPTISTTQINGTCNSNTGSITASGSGGTAPYQYNINGGAYFASGVFNNLLPGIYAVGVKDATGCTTGTQVTLSNPSNPTVTAVALSTSCNLNNGTITATGTDGVAPLQYSIDAMNFQSSNIFAGLAAGIYTVYIKDANQCFGSTTISILNTAVPKVTAFTIAANCNSNDGSIVASGTSGEAPYDFSIDGTLYQSSGTFNNLAAGFYTVYIRDARGCITTTGVSIDNTSGLSITNTATISAKCGTATGSITVTATGGTAPLQFSIDGIIFQASNIFNGLLPGNFTITVKDANGCLTTRAVTLGNILGPQILTAVIINAACGLNNGTITATASGGTAPLQYSIDGTTYQAGNIFNGLAANTYTLYVKDANGCIKILPVIIANLPAPLLTATASPASCGLSDGTITAVATGGTLPLTYSKDGSTFQSSNIFLNLAAGPYTITVKDARGCTNTFNITVTTIGTTSTPTFTPVAPICSGATLTALPTTSINGITGTWAPALNNTATTVYTFTPTAGQCATTATLIITVNPKPLPIIIYHN